MTFVAIGCQHQPLPGQGNVSTAAPRGGTVPPTAKPPARYGAIEARVRAASHSAATPTARNVTGTPHAKDYTRVTHPSPFAGGPGKHPEDLRCDGWPGPIQRTLGPLSVGAGPGLASPSARRPAHARANRPSRSKSPGPPAAGAHGDAPTDAHS